MSTGALATKPLSAKIGSGHALDIVSLVKSYGDVEVLKDIAFGMKVRLPERLGSEIGDETSLAVDPIGLCYFDTESGRLIA